MITVKRKKDYREKARPSNSRKPHEKSRKYLDGHLQVQLDWSSPALEYYLP